MVFAVFIESEQEGRATDESHEETQKDVAATHRPVIESSLPSRHLNRYIEYVVSDTQ